MWGPETLQDNEKYPEAEKKIANVKKNLLAYFDTDYIKGLFDTSKADFRSIEEQEEVSDTKLNGKIETTTQSFFWAQGEKYYKRHIKWDPESIYRYTKWQAEPPYLEEKISEKIYNDTLAGANEIQKNKTLADTQTFIKNIDSIVVIAPRRQWDNSQYAEDNGTYSPGDNKLYFPDDVNELTVAHEVMHALQYNCHRTKNLLTLNDSKITPVTKELWNKFLLQYNSYNADIKDIEEARLRYKEFWQEEEWELAKLQEEYKDKLQDKDYIKGSKEEKKLINFYNKKVTKVDKELAKYDKKKTQRDSKLEVEYKETTFSEPEFHAYVFQLKYACSLYLWIKLWTPITMDDIDKLKDNKDYEKDSTNIFDFIKYIKFIDQEITEEKDPKIRLELFEDRLTVLTELLDLANNDLVMNDVSPKENKVVESA